MTEMSKLKDLDWANFSGPKLNVEWKPDDQDLSYTAMNWLDGEGDADEDCGQQLVERLLAAWKAEHAARNEIIGLVDRVERAEKALRTVHTWAEQRCPCRNEEPNPCPLCLADANNPRDICLSAENTLPEHVLSEVRAALTKGTSHEQ